MATTLDVGEVWEIDSELLDTLQTLTVYAGPNGIRVVDYWCGEWEEAEQHALRLTPEIARVVAQALNAAADASDRRASLWRTHLTQADPEQALHKARLAKFKRPQVSRTT